MTDVSVIIAAFDAEEFLDAALASVAAQTHRPHEVIVVDDGSSDATAATARRWATLLPLVLIEKEVNAGLGSARRTAGEVASGDAMAILDADDVWFPDHLETMLSLFANDTTIVTPSTLRWYPGGQLGTVGSTELFPIPEAQHQLDELLQWNYLFSGCLFSRTAYLAAGGFSDRRKNEDWELWIRMLRAGSVVVGAPRPTVLYRQHASSLSSADGTLGADIDMYEELLGTAEGTDRSTITAALRRRVARRTLLEGLDRLEHGSRAEARRLFARAAFQDRSMRGGLSSRSGSVSLRALAAIAVPGQALRQRRARNSDPDAIRT